MVMVMVMATMRLVSFLMILHCPGNLFNIDITPMWGFQQVEGQGRYITNC